MTRKRRLFSIAPVLAAIVGALAPSAARAHRLNAFAYLEGSEVKVEAYFSDGAKAKGAEVRAYGPGKKLLVKGKTDKKGEYAFRLPATEGDLLIVVTAGEEHVGKYTLKAEEFEGVAGVEYPEIVEAEGESGGEAPGDMGKALARIEATLRNVQRQLAELRKPRAGVSLESVMAGIGFIVGLTGVAMFFMARHAARK